MTSDAKDTLSGIPTNSGAPQELTTGSRLGAYTLLEPLGRGGMGQVWKATDGKRPVAVKLLPPEFRGHPEAIAQVDEAFRIVHALTHEHICKTLGLHDDPQHGPYLVMDYVPGVRLSEFQRRGNFPGRRMPLELVLQVLRPIAVALDYAHQKVVRHADREQKGVLHRDVKPDNILLVTRDGRIEEVWLIDFGLAAEIRNSLTRHTNKTADTRGTRPYMSPEQLRGKRQHWDGRTDQYALAVVAYELLAGHLPFDSDDDFVLMLAIKEESPDPIDGLSASVNAALLKGLAKTKEARYATCREFVAALTSPSAPPRIVDREPVRPAPPPPLLVAPFDAGAAQRSQAEWARFLGASVEWTNSIGMKFGLIPPGEFLMGSPDTEVSRKTDEGPQHQVRIPQPLYIGVYEVTQGEWQSVMGTNPTYFAATGGGKDKVAGLDTSRFPVETVSWYDAIEFCNKLSQREGLTAYYALTGIERADGSIKNAVVSVAGGQGYRLPTEAEWEYACRAGTTTPFHFGTVNNRRDANIDGNEPYGTTNTGPSLQRPATVGSYQANAFGLYDMHGNVWEWCADWYGPYAAGGTVSDPRGPSEGSGRVFRGGSWFYSAGSCRSADRYGLTPDYRLSDLGFRLARSSGP